MNKVLHKNNNKQLNKKLFLQVHIICSLYYVFRSNIKEKDKYHTGNMPSIQS